MNTTTVLRPSVPNPAAPGTFVFLAPLPALQAQCPECGGYIKYLTGWMCMTCDWTDALLGHAPRGWGGGTGEGVG